jgi:putative FmdB family regulatory protein
MPLYDYRCSKCNHTFEQFQKIDDRNKPTRKPCPKCKKNKVELALFGVAAICDPVRIGVKKHDKGWHEVMSRVNKSNRTKIQDKFS